MISVDRVNSIGAANTIVGWFAGLAWVYFGDRIVGLGTLDWIILIIGGMFGASIVIGGGLALVAALLTKLSTGNAASSPHAFSWMALIAPVVAFFCANPVARLLA